MSGEAGLPASEMLMHVVLALETGAERLPAGGMQVPSLWPRIPKPPDELMDAEPQGPEAFEYRESWVDFAAAVWLLLEVRGEGMRHDRTCPHLRSPHVTCECHPVPLFSLGCLPREAPGRRAPLPEEEPEVRCLVCDRRIFGEIARRGACLSCVPLVPDDTDPIEESGPT